MIEKYQNYIKKSDIFFTKIIIFFPTLLHNQSFNNNNKKGYFQPAP